MILRLFLLLIPIFICAQTTTELEYYLPNSDQYRIEIPTPKSIIGHQVGQWHVTHDKLLHYMYALAKTSDRVQIENRGVTFEGRPLILLTITSAENHENLETIRTSHVQATESNKALDIENRPVVVYQGFSIHGNEASGSNAALLLAYHLAASESNEVKNLLK